jgi:mRNA-degrading endonuclease toxin of MazEF toxin-antitoxin module
VLVVSRDALNRGGRIMVVLITSGRFEQRRRLRNCVPLRAGEFGLSRDCVVQCETMATAAVEQLDGPPLGRLDDLVMRSVIKAIGDAIAADCEPVQALPSVLGVASLADSLPAKVASRGVRGVMCWHGS